VQASLLEVEPPAELQQSAFVVQPVKPLAMQTGSGTHIPSVQDVPAADVQQSVLKVHPVPRSGTLSGGTEDDKLIELVGLVELVV
jgi:hypothetical protein